MLPGLWLPKGIVCAVLAGGVLAGCAGSSSSSAPPQGSTNQTVADFTAVVSVNVSTRAVTFTPSSAASKTNRTVFTGPTVSMSSTTLVTQAGTPGVKSTLVTLTNNSSSPIGVDPNGNVVGLRVLFGAFTVTGGSSADPVGLSNQTGFFPSPAAANVPYIVYPAQIAPNKTSPAQNWNFVVPSGITAFSVSVTIEADNSYLAPANGSSNVGSSSVYVRTVAGSPVGGYANGSGIQSRFNGLGLISLDRAGNAYVVDSRNEAIRRITPSGFVSTVAGSPFLKPAMVNGPGNVATFNQPGATAVTPDGSTIFVSDISDNAIRRISLTGSDPTNPADWNVTTIAGTGAAGGNYSTPMLGSQATLNEPYGIALDSAGNLVLTEAGGNRIRRMTFLGGDPSSGANWEVTLVAGDASAVYGAGGDSDAPPTTFSQPSGIAVDQAGNCYVADAFNARIRKITVDGVTTTIAGGTSGSTVKQGYVDGPGATAQFFGPSGVAVDSSGLVYVTDTNNFRVREISLADNVTTIAGTTGNSSIDGTGNTAAFHQPSGIAVSSSGTLYIGDQTELRVIERIDPQ